MKSLLAVITLSLAAVATAQNPQSVTLTNVLDLAVAGAQVNASTYSIAEDKFIFSAAGTELRVYNGTTGAFESTVNISTVSPAPTGLGFFGLAAGSDGSLFAFENTGLKHYQWDNVADATATDAGAAPFARCGAVIDTGVNTKLCMTGNANQGPINIFTTTDDITYTQTDTVPGNPTDPNFGSKSSMAINQAVNAAWAVGDTGTPIRKSVKTTGWLADPGFVAPAATNASSSLAYDNVNNVLFSLRTTTVSALHGSTGASLGTATITAAGNATPGNGGGYVSSVPGSGTVWLSGRGNPATNAVMQKFTYTVTFPAGVSDWCMY